MYKLTILIPTIPERNVMLDALLSKIYCQLTEGGFIGQVQVITDQSMNMTIGEKRNSMMRVAKGDYVCFIDDDDDISPDYIRLIMEGIETNPDCCSLIGEMTWNGTNPQLFEHSIKYNAYKTNINNRIMYERFPNHLNCVKTSIAKQFEFPHWKSGEDTEQACRMFNSGLLKTEYEIKSVIYHYRYKSK